MKILFLSHTPMGGTFVVGSHHLSRNMVRLGHDVVHLSPPVTFGHLALITRPFERKRFSRWIKSGKIFDGACDLIPASLIPWGVAKLFSNPFKVFGQAVRPSVLRLLSKHDFLQPDIIFIDEPRLGYLLDDFKGAKIVYRPTDIYAQIRNDPTIIEVEREVIQRAHAFIATSQPVADHIRSLGVDDVLVIENGVDLDYFVNGPDFDVENELPTPPRAVYAGALDHRFGIDSVIEAAKGNPKVSFVLIGPVSSIVKAAFESMTNVHLLGSVPYEKLPSYLRRCQLGLLPMSDDPSNQGRSPMKLYEYAAVGLPVVATTTIELRGRLLPFLRLSSTPTEFCNHVTKLVSVSSEIFNQTYDVHGHSWQSKCEQVLLYSMESKL